MAPGDQERARRTATAATTAAIAACSWLVSLPVEDRRFSRTRPTDGLYRGYETRPGTPRCACSTGSAAHRAWTAGCRRASHGPRAARHGAA